MKKINQSPIYDEQRFVAIMQANLCWLETQIELEASSSFGQGSSLLWTHTLRPL